MREPSPVPFKGSTLRDISGVFFISQRTKLERPFPMVKGSSANGLAGARTSELPEASNASMVVPIVVVVGEPDAEARRGEAPHHRLQALNIFLTTRKSPWFIAE